VEFTLVLPLLLVLLFGILEFGRAINYWIDETHLANMAARFAAVGKNPGDGGTLCDSIRSMADTEELRSGGTSSVPTPVQVTVDNGAEVGDPLQATVTLEYHWLPFLGDRLDVVSTTMTGAATMRVEQDPDHPDNEVGEGCST
jgi:Flp pilus assembly protein TadG